MPKRGGQETVKKWGPSTRVAKGQGGRVGGSNRSAGHAAGGGGWQQRHAIMQSGGRGGARCGGTVWGGPQQAICSTTAQRNRDIFYLFK
jgi:hypothetical protein